MNDLAATVVVHWPGQSTAACRRHADGLQRVAQAMGMPRVTETPVPEPLDCANCINEQKKKED